MTRRCLKREVCAVIIDNKGRIAVGQNLIKNKVESCPRIPGEGYEKCQTICHQSGHAETEAIKKAKKLGLTLKGATLYLHNHYRVCYDCSIACEKEGIKTIILGDV